MTKNVTVRIEKQYSVTIDAEYLTQEFISEFESYMFELDGDTLDEKIDSLHAYAAQQIAEYGAEFVEGIGEVASVMSAQYRRAAGQKIVIEYSEGWSDVEVEVSSGEEVE